MSNEHMKADPGPGNRCGPLILFAEREAQEAARHLMIRRALILQYAGRSETTND